MTDLTTSVFNTCRAWFEPFSDLLTIKGFLAAGSIWLGFIFGVEFYNYVFLIVWLVVLDSLTGLWGAKASGEVISSAKFSRVLPKLMRYLVFVAAGHALQKTIGVNLYVENVVFIFLAATEFISIAENLGKAGMPVPKKLLNKIEELRDRQ